MNELTRRRFLQIGATGAAGLILTDGLWRLVSASQEDEWAPTLARLGEPVPTTCGLCPSACGLLCFLDGDQLQGIFGNPEHPSNQGRLCARGLAGANLLSDPDRVLHPLKRTARRGAGQWKRITWDEAFDALASKMSSLIGQGRVESMVFDLDRQEQIVGRFLAALGQPTVLDRFSVDRLNERAAMRLSLGWEAAAVDPGQSSIVVLLGADPVEQYQPSLSFVQSLIQARVDRGARLVTFDVRHSNTAATSSESFLLRPGTEGLVVLAMANVILGENLYDRQFITARTNYPVDLLAGHLGSYTVERASVSSGIAGDDIRRIARELASSKPAVVLGGYGLGQGELGLSAQRAILLLNALTGNIGVPGGLCQAVLPSMPEPSPHAAGRALRPWPEPQASSLLALAEQNLGADLVVTCRSNPVYDDPDCRKTAELLQDESRFSLIVSLDTNMTETAACADMVLPLASFLESWDLRPCVSLQGQGHVSLQQPVVRRQAETAFLKAGARISSPPFRPLGEALAFGDVCIELAQRIGGDVARAFGFRSCQEYVELVAGQWPGLEPEGGLSYLKKTGFWKPGDAPDQAHIGQATQFGTASGRFEVYSELLAGLGHDPLPSWKQAQGESLKEGITFTLVTFHHHLHTGATANCKWLVEMSHAHPVWIHADRARGLGLGQGDQVVISSSVGEVTATVHLTGAIHPDAVAMAKGYAHWEWGKFAQASKEQSDDPDTQLIWWGKVGTGVHPNVLVPVRCDPVTGAQVWQGTEVSVRKRS